MSCCVSFTSLKEWCFRISFKNSGLRSTTTDLGDGTVMHCWVPKQPQQSKPNLLLIHGFGNNALWQWSDVVGRMTPYFNVYVPDLVFFGESYTTKPDRTDAFQAQCIIRLMEELSVNARLSVVGLSYGGFVAYSIAAQAQLQNVVEKVVICCSAVCMEEKDITEGRFNVPDLESAADILLPQTPEKLKELLNFTLVKPPKIVPSCLLNDFIHVMCREYLQEKRELIRAIPRDRKLDEIPKITQPTLIIWGDQDQIFPLEFGYRLKNHIGDNAVLAIIENAGHGFSMERPKEFYSHLKTFLIDDHVSHANDTHQNGK
ncbi:uncharacterized protein LOC141585871 [Silene latifolia]|uniref:uncharacterized protein LOC141585871 n=1 Tax=Silene latifolia TaxID=37657 RepID=UPI003D788416